MRVYGRRYDSAGRVIPRTWTVVETDAKGNNDAVYVTALCQYLKLNLNESPRFAWAGIPARDAVAQQVPPDNYVAFAQQLFAPYFVSLIISRQPQSLTPTYNVNILTHTGASLALSVPR